MSSFLSGAVSDVENVGSEVFGSNSTSTSPGSSNFFQRVFNDAKNIEQEVLGPDYNYVIKIKKPSELGMSDDGNLDALAKDVGGLIAYVELLVSGVSDASKTGQPLGNKFFLETGAKCIDSATGMQVTRSLYVNNVPNGNIPFLSGAMGGVDIKEFRGLVPGVISNLSTINPLKIFQGFKTGTPSCSLINMETIDQNDVKDSKSGYVIDDDVKGMDPCWFGDSTNPLTGVACQMEGFQDQKKNHIKKKKHDCSKMPNDPYVKLYYSALGIFGLYILLLVFSRKR